MRAPNVDPEVPGDAIGGRDRIGAPPVTDSDSVIKNLIVVAAVPRNAMSNNDSVPCRDLVPSVSVRENLVDVRVRPDESP